MRVGVRVRVPLLPPTSYRNYMTNVVYIARSKITGDLIFIGLGESYPQHEYDLLYSMSAEQAMQMLISSQKD